MTDKHVFLNKLYRLAYVNDAYVDTGWHNFWIVYPNGWKLSVLPPGEMGYIEIAVINPEGNRIDIDGDYAQMGLDTFEELSQWAEKVAKYGHG